MGEKNKRYNYYLVARAASWVIITFYLHHVFSAHLCRCKGDKDIKEQGRMLFSPLSNLTTERFFNLIAFQAKSHFCHIGFDRIRVKIGSRA